MKSHVQGHTQDELNVWVIAFVGEEGCDSSSSTECFVVGKLVKWKEFSPIVLLVVAIDSEVLFQSLISLFCLAITFRMISIGEV